VDDLWAMKSEDFGLIVHAISFQGFQLMRHHHHIRLFWVDTRTHATKQRKKGKGQAQMSFKNTNVILKYCNMTLTLNQ